MASEVNTGAGTSPLSVLIVGAGIGGLAAAIALRQQGHNVEMFERSRFANEIGAAIHLTPNATGLLKRIGVDPREYGAVRTEQIRDYTSEGDFSFAGKISQFADTWQHEWYLIHRAHLHQALKDKAASDGKGRPVVLHTSSKVASVDPAAATVILESGEAFKGDVVIGADGVHSVARCGISGEDIKAFSSGKNAFRFMVSRKEVLDDPETAHMAKDLGTVDMWHGADSKIVIYPCVNNEVLNFVCIHPANLTNAGISKGWDQAIGKETLVDVYKTYEPAIRKMLSKAHADDLKIWPLLDMETLPTWTNEHLAIIGDAAHPFLPYRASGGAMAIEDGICMAVMLPKGVRNGDVVDRLKLYEKARHERVTAIQEFTRESGRRHLPMDEAMRIMSFIYDHDEWDYSSDLLRRHIWAQNPHVYYRQPSVFGPIPGPRQDFQGRSRAAASAKATFRTASIQFKTSRTLLRNILPNSSYSFAGNGSVAYATISQTSLNGLDWLAGGGYNHFGLYIHGVQFTGPDGQVTEGSYLPVLFEDFADPIISGREELGFPKLFSAIDVQSRHDSYHVTTSWRGATWGRMSLTGLRPVSANAPAAPSGLLVHRYMPSVGKDFKGTPEAEYPVFVDCEKDAEAVRPIIKRVSEATTGTFDIDGLDWNQLPTLHHILVRLSEVPVYEIVDARVVEGEGVADVSSARRIVHL